MRVNHAPLFTNVGIDFAGPLTLLDKESANCYVCLSTCASTRVVHLKVTETLGPVHTAPFSLLSVSNEFAMKTISVDTAAATTFLFIPFAKQCHLLAAVKKAPIASLNATMLLYSIAFQQRDVKRFQIRLQKQTVFKLMRFQ